MKVSWFVPVVRKWPWQKWYDYDRVAASVWIRCLQLVPYLNPLGVESKINSWNHQTNVAVFLRCWDKSMIALAKKMQHAGIKVIIDTPVNYFSSQNLKPFQGDAKHRFDEFVEFADAVFCPSPYIAEFGEGKGYNTFCLHDSIDLNHFKYKKERKIGNGKPVLIWSGVQVKSSAINFLSSIIRKHSWKVIIISDKVPDFDFKFDFFKWSYKSFPKDLLKGDIGIFPRKVEDEYDKGHSFFKIGVFLAQQIPVICNPVPSYKDVMTASNSISISSHDKYEWEEQIISMAEKYNDQTIDKNPIEKYSTKKLAERYVEIFQQIL